MKLKGYFQNQHNDTVVWVPLNKQFFVQIKNNLDSSQIKSVFSRFYLSKEYLLNLHEPGNLFMLKKKKYLFKPQP